MQNRVKNPYDTSTEIGRARAAAWDAQFPGGIAPALSTVLGGSAAAPVSPEAERERAITEICVLVDKPALAAGFIASGKSYGAVVSELRAQMSTALPWKTVIAKIEGRALAK